MGEKHTNPTELTLEMTWGKKKSSQLKTQQR